MESKQTSILDLNDYCLGQVLKYLKLEDHVRFAETCTQFRDVFREWFYVLYPEFEIKLCSDPDNNVVEWKLKLLRIVRDIIKRLSVSCEKPLSDDDFVTKLCKEIEGMNNLEYLAVQEGGLFGRLELTTNPFRFQPIESVLTALETLPKLKSISLNCRTNK